MTILILLCVSDTISSKSLNTTMHMTPHPLSSRKKQQQQTNYQWQTKSFQA